MHIAIGGRILTHKQREGIGWYSDQMIREMALLRPEYRFSVIVHKGIENEFEWPPNVQLVKVGINRFDPFGLPWYLYVTLPRTIAELKPDIFWSPDGIAPINRICPTVITIHDISPMVLPETMRFRDRVYFNRYLKKAVAYSDHFFTVSNFSKTEIISMLPIPAEKITVTYNGVRSNLKPTMTNSRRQSRIKYALGQPYMLHIGAIHPRKNVIDVVKGFELYHNTKKNSDLVLVLAGRKAWRSEDVFDYIESSGVKHKIRWLDYVPDEEMAALINGAELLVNYSHHEGFGMSVIEAMACHVPVICSTKGALREIAGTAAVYAGNVESLSESIDRVLNNKQLRSKLIEAGITQQKKFQWSQSAHNGILIFESLDR
jgi:glycosyltransferase involved in cell wall biosynthesis